MRKSKPPEQPHDAGKVELSNAETEAEPNTLEAVRTLADDRARRIELLERERDQLKRDLDQHNGESHKALLGGGRFDVRVASIDVLTAPEHSLVMRVLGEEDALTRLAVELRKALVPVEAASPDGVSVQTEKLPADVRAVVENQPS